MMGSCLCLVSVWGHQHFDSCSKSSEFLKRLNHWSPTLIPFAFREVRDVDSWTYIGPCVDLWHREWTSSYVFFPSTVHISTRLGPENKQTKTDPCDDSNNYGIDCSCFHFQVLGNLSLSPLLHLPDRRSCRPVKEWPKKRKEGRHCFLRKPAGGQWVKPKTLFKTALLNDASDYSSFPSALGRVERDRWIFELHGHRLGVQEFRGREGGRGSRRKEDAG